MIALFLLLGALSPTSVVYPKADNGLVFDHAKHTAVECTHCHSKVKGSARSADRLLPTEAACVGCHKLFGSANAPDCARCHRDYHPVLDPGTQDTRKARPWPKQTSTRSPALKFGHAPHLQRGARCADCHGLPKAPTLPKMSTCQGCHDGKLAPDRCETCHLTHPDGRLQTALPFGRLRPASHDAPRFAASGHSIPGRMPDSCSSCHQKTDCQTCHDSRIRSLEIHPGDYLVTHPAEARRNDPDCGKCHRRATFCVDCHTRGGVVDQSQEAPFGTGLARRTRFHPEGFAGLLGGAPAANHHRIAARRNVAECASCHQESSCIKCHSTSAPAALRASPHPPGFRRRCDRALDANDRGCLKCHTHRAELRTLCR